MLRYTTPIPNRFFDELMKGLSSSAVRVYLKIARNTVGWRDKHGEVKPRDWISHSQFAQVGVSSRSVTTAIEELLSQKLILATDEQGNLLSRPGQRKNAKRIFYGLILENNENPTSNNARTDKTKGQFLPTTKENSTKERYSANERISDHERLQQILQHEEGKQSQRDKWL